MLVLKETRPERLPCFLRHERAVGQAQGYIILRHTLPHVFEFEQMIPPNAKKTKRFYSRFATSICCQWLHLSALD